MEKFCKGITVTQCLVIITFIGAVIRVSGIAHYYYSYDEMWHIHTAKQATLAKIYYTDLISTSHPLMPYFIWHYILKLWDDPLMVRLPSLITGILSIPLAYFLGKTLFRSSYGGIFTAFFISFSNLMVEQSQLVRGYSMMMFFSIIALWGLYSYRSNPKFRYVILYFISMFLASLCEFATAEILVFTSSYLLYLIWKNSERKYFFISIAVILNLLLLLYFLWFQGKLAVIGNFHDFRGYNTLNNKGTGVFIYSMIYQLILEISIPVILWPTVEILQIFSSISAIFICSGLIAIIKNRKWPELLFIVSFFLVMFVLYEFDKIIITLARRYIGMVFPALILTYSGAEYLYKEVLRLKTVNIKYLNLLLSFFSLFFLVLFLSNPEDYRKYSFEFMYDRDHIKEFFIDLDKNIEKNDLVLTQRSVFHFLWEKYGDGDLLKIYPNNSLYNKYKVPVYVYNEDFKLCFPSCFPVYGLQESVKELYNNRKLDDKSILWIVSISGQIDAISSVYGGGNERVLSKEKIEFYNWLIKHSIYKKIKKFDGREIYAIYGIPANIIAKKMLSSNYHN